MSTKQSPIVFCRFVFVLARLKTWSVAAKSCSYANQRFPIYLFVLGVQQPRCNVSASIAWMAAGWITKPSRGSAYQMMKWVWWQPRSAKYGVVINSKIIKLQRRGWVMDKFAAFCQKKLCQYSRLQWQSKWRFPLAAWRPNLPGHPIKKRVASRHIADIQASMLLVV